MAAPKPVVHPALHAAATQRAARPAPRSLHLAALALAPALDSHGGDTTQNRAYRALKMAVLSGRFHPGTPVTLSRLSEMLGTSDMPVREALKRLTAEGAFEALPNRSARVPVPSPQTLRQILELRIELEGRAAAQAAEHMSKRHIEQLATMDADMFRALDDEDLPRYVQLNTEFHFTIYRLAANEPLLSLIEALWLRMAPVVAFNLTRVDNARAIRRDAVCRAHHGNLIDAFKALDGERACREMQADLLHPSGLKNYFEPAVGIPPAD